MAPSKKGGKTAAAPVVAHDEDDLIQVRRGFAIATATRRARMDGWMAARDRSDDGARDDASRDDRRRGETRAKDARRDRDARETEGAADAREGRRWGFRIGPGAALRARGEDARGTTREGGASATRGGATRDGTREGGERRDARGGGDGRRRETRDVGD